MAAIMTRIMMPRPNQNTFFLDAAGYSRIVVEEEIVSFVSFACIACFSLA
jgi:hypothetical protein